MHIKLCSDRMKGKNFKLKENRFRSDIGKEFLPERLVRCWGSCGWPIPGTFKVRLDKDWNWMIFKFHSKPTHPMIVWSPSSCWTLLSLQGASRAGCQGRGSHLVVEGTDVQGRVPRGVLRAHVGPVEQQVLQVLHVAVPASLGREAAIFWLLHGLGKSSRQRCSAEKVLFFTEGLIFRSMLGSLMGAQTPRCLCTNSIVGTSGTAIQCLSLTIWLFWEWQPKGSRKYSLWNFLSTTVHDSDVTTFFVLLHSRALPTRWHWRWSDCQSIFPKVLTSLRRKIWPKSK